MEREGCQHGQGTRHFTEITSLSTHSPCSLHFRDNERDIQRGDATYSESAGRPRVKCRSPWLLPLFPPQCVIALPCPPQLTPWTGSRNLKDKWNSGRLYSIYFQNTALSNFIWFSLILQWDWGWGWGRGIEGFFMEEFQIKIDWSFFICTFVDFCCFLLTEVFCFKMESVIYFLRSRLQWSFFSYLCICLNIYATIYSRFWRLALFEKTLCTILQLTKETIKA